MKVAVIEGGPSTEAEVSRKSGEAVADALVQAGHDVQRLELTLELAVELRAWSPDVVFPAVHGSMGEDGCLQGLLEVLGFPYVGSDVRASALAADKIATKMFLREVGLPVAAERRLTASDQARTPAELFSELKVSLGEEMVIKPAQGGSTIGIERLLVGATADDFSGALAAALQHDSVVLAETYVAGAELTCAVLDEDDGPRALPVTLIKSEASEWYDFESKYAVGGSIHVCPAPLPPEVALAIQEASVRAHCALGARDLSRTDFILATDGIAYLLELNTLPGMTDVSLLPEAAAADGLDFPSLTDRLVRRAASRGVRTRLTGRPLPGS